MVIGWFHAYGTELFEALLGGVVEINFKPGANRVYFIDPFKVTYFF